MHFDNLVLDEPAGWVQRRMLSLRAPRRARNPSDRDPSIIVARVPRVETLENTTLMHLVRLAKQLPQFDLLDRSTARVGGREATRARFRALRGARMQEEICVYVDAPEGDVVLLSCSWADGAADSKETLEHFERMLGTARFEVEAPSQPPVGRTSRPPEPVERPWESAVPMPGRRDDR